MKELSGIKKKILAGAGFSTDSKQDSEALGKRIRNISISGSFKIPEEWQDYEVLDSTDVFRVLYLDAESWEEYSDELVRHHHKEISNFLSHLQKLGHQGINWQHAYPNLNLEKAIDQVNKAMQRVATHSNREKEYLRFIEDFKIKGKPELESLIRAIFSDEKLVISESKEFIESAMRWKYSQDEASEILLSEVKKREYIPVSTISESMNSFEKLTSTDWVSKTQKTENKIDFTIGLGEKGSAIIHNLVDLGTYLYNNKQEGIQLLKSQKLVHAILPHFPYVAEKLSNIIKSNSDEESRYLSAVYLLNPSLPFCLNSYNVFASPKDLATKVLNGNDSLINMVLQSLNMGYMQIWWRIWDRSIDTLLEQRRKSIEELIPKEEKGIIESIFDGVVNFFSGPSKPSFSKYQLLATLYSIDSDLPYYLSENLKFNTPEELAKYLYCHDGLDEEFADQFFLKMVNYWLIGKGENWKQQVETFSDLIKEPDFSREDFQPIIAFILDPGLNFRVTDEIAISDLADIITILKKDWSKWNQLKKVMSSDSFVWWLLVRGNWDFVEKTGEIADELKAKGLYNDDTLFDTFLHLIHEADPVVFTVSPDAVELVQLSKGSKKIIEFEIKKTGLGHLCAKPEVTIVTQKRENIDIPVPSVSEISIPIGKESAKFSIILQNSSGLGFKTEFLVTLRSNHGDIMIPVSFISKFPVGRLVRYGVVWAVLVGTLCTLTRYLLGRLDFFETGNIIDKMFYLPVAILSPWNYAIYGCLWGFLTGVIIFSNKEQLPIVVAKVSLALILLVTMYAVVNLFIHI